MDRYVEWRVIGQIFICCRVDITDIRMRRQPPALSYDPFHTANRFVTILTVVHTKFNE
ncbi:hypothetical protein D3C85_1014620 [compost metagenome]